MVVLVGANISFKGNDPDCLPLGVLVGANISFSGNDWLKKIVPAAQMMPAALFFMRCRYIEARASRAPLDVLITSMFKFPQIAWMIQVNGLFPTENTLHYDILFATI